MYHAKVTLLGNITDEPMLQFFDEQREQPYCRFSLALNRKYKARDGNRVEEAHFFECFARGEVAKSIKEYAQKGSRMLVAGELRQDRWKDEADLPRSRVIVHVTDFPEIFRKPERA